MSTPVKLTYDVFVSDPPPHCRIGRCVMESEVDRVLTAT